MDRLQHQHSDDGDDGVRKEKLKRNTYSVITKKDKKESHFFPLLCRIRLCFVVQFIVICSHSTLLLFLFHTFAYNLRLLSTVIHCATVTIAGTHSSAFRI